MTKLLMATIITDDAEAEPVAVHTQDDQVCLTLDSGLQIWLDAGELVEACVLERWPVEDAA